MLWVGFEVVGCLTFLYLLRCGWCETQTSKVHNIQPVMQENSKERGQKPAAHQEMEFWRPQLALQAAVCCRWGARPLPGTRRPQKAAAAQGLLGGQEIALHAGSPADRYKPSAQQQKFSVHLEHLSTRGLYFSVQSSRMCSNFTLTLLALARVMQLGVAVLQAFLQLRLEAAVPQRRNCSLRD